MTDIPAFNPDASNQLPQSSLAPVVLIAMMAKPTDRFGFITTMSTSLHEPFMIARAMSSLDLVSKGRMGWNLVTTGTRRYCSTTSQAY